MANNKKTRKQYRAKYPAIPITIGLSSEQQTNLRLPPHMILDAFINGAGTEEGAHTLIAAVNLGAVLSRDYHFKVQDAINPGLVAVQSVKDRGERNGKWGVTGDEYKAIAAALTLSDDMQDITTRKGLREAVRSVYKEAACS